jgi:type IV secretion system protein VirD4
MTDKEIYGLIRFNVNGDGFGVPVFAGTQNALLVAETDNCLFILKYHQLYDTHNYNIVKIEDKVLRRRYCVGDNIPIPFILNGELYIVNNLHDEKFLELRQAAGENDVLMSVYNILKRGEEGRRVETQEGVDRDASDHNWGGGPKIWATNGGIYLGSRLKTAHEGQDLLLKDLRGRARTSADEPIKSSLERGAGLNNYIGEGHVCTIGPNGSGKTRKLLMTNLYRLKDWSCVVIDPKGELCAHTAVHRAKREGHRVVVLDPFAVMPQNYPHLYEKHGDILQSHGFNPLTSCDPASPTFIDDINTLAKALVRTDDARDPYWTMAAQGLIKGLLLARKVDKFGAQANLTEVRDILGTSPQALANFCAARIDDLGERWPAIGASLSEFARCSPDDRELSSIRRTARVHTDWLDSPNMRENVEGGSFDFATLKETPTTVYLVLPPELLASCAIWLRVMVVSILRALLRSVTKARVPVLLMLDEFAQLGCMELIEDNYGLMRGYGVKLWMIWQNLTQAKVLYKERWESFISNAGIVQTFAPQDLTTRDYLSKLGGERIRWHETNTSGQNLALNGGPSTDSSRGQPHIIEPLLKPHELAALDHDETVLFGDGTIELSITPQPDLVEFCAADLAAARRAI